MLKTIFCLMVLFPAAAFANGSGSEYFHQPEEGAHELTPSLYLHSEETKFKSGGKSEKSTNTISAQYEYGWMEDVTLGALLGYTISGDYEDTTLATRGDISGLNNIKAFVKANIPAGRGNFHYGATLSLSTTDAEINSYGDKNVATGGHDLIPYVGYEQGTYKSTFGAKLSFEIGLAEKSLDDDGTKREVTGGNETVLSFFYEHQLNEQMLLGVAADWRTTSDTDTKTVNTTTTSENISPVQLISVYLATKLGAGTLLPELEYGIATDERVNNQEVDSYSQLNIKVGYRIAL